MGRGRRWREMLIDIKARGLLPDACIDMGHLLFRQRLRDWYDRRSLRLNERNLHPFTDPLLGQHRHDFAG